MSVLNECGRLTGNSYSEPILTFRFWLLSTFWVVAGCTVSTIYYFKPYSNTLTSYAVQLLSWGMGDRLAKWLPNKDIKVFRWSFNLNPGPWNAKEHALIVVAYWGSVSPCPDTFLLPTRAELRTDNVPG